MMVQVSLIELIDCRLLIEGADAVALYACTETLGLGEFSPLRHLGTLLSDSFVCTHGTLAI
jgi:hypothetical protein